MFSKDNKRLPNLGQDTRPFSPTSIVASPKGGSPGFRIRRYLTSRIDKHPATKKLTYETPNKAHALKEPVRKNNTLPTRTLPAPIPQPQPLLPPVQSVPTTKEATAPTDASLSTLSVQSESEVVDPEHILLHQGNKLFWRINRTIDFRIYQWMSLQAVVIRSYDSTDNFEFPPLVLDWSKIVPQIKQNEAATAAHQAALSLFDNETPVGVHEEDEILKQRRRKKDASRRKSASSMTEGEVEEARIKKEQEKEAGELREMDEMRGKVVSFVISRLEASKSKETGVISTSVVKRPSDSIPSFVFDEIPAAALKVGSLASWNKKENSTSIRRKSTELVQGLQEANAASKKASEKQVAIQTALDIVKVLSDRDQFNKLSPHHKKFQMGLRKAIFQTRLEKMQDALAASDEYKKFAAESAH